MLNYFVEVANLDKLAKYKKNNSQWLLSIMDFEHPGE